MGHMTFYIEDIFVFYNERELLVTNLSLLYLQMNLTGIQNKKYVFSHMKNASLFLNHYDLSI